MSNKNKTENKELTPEMKKKLDDWWDGFLAERYAKERKSVRDYIQQHENHRPL